MRLKPALFLILLAASARRHSPSRATPPNSARRSRRSPKNSPRSRACPCAIPCPATSSRKEKIKEFLNKRIKEVAKPEDLRAEELTLKKFGLVPPDFDLAKNTVDLLTEQAAAFYDYDRKKLFITDTTSSETQEPVLAHEIAHAIADQNYNLAKFIKAGRKSDDGATARLAVMEGQATWLMSELLARKMGQSLKDSPALLAMMSGASDGGAGQFPVFDNAPLYLRLTLVFPYTKGMLFQNAVFERDGTERFRRGLPQAARLHPADSPPGKILQRRQAHRAGTARSPTFPKATRAWWADRSANWSIRSCWSSTPARRAPPKSRRTGAAAPSTCWRTRRPAASCCSTPRSGTAKTPPASISPPIAGSSRKKWKQMTVATETADAVTGTGDDGRFELRRKGATVTSMEGLPPAID